MGQFALGLAGAAVGSLGGPTGAQIGWMLGSFAWNLLDPPKIEGPRLHDTKVGGADYGTMRPILYGTARIGGIGMGQGSISEGPNKFTEHEEKSGGKGGPEVTSFRYTLSFWNEICEGPIYGVQRRWANGRLITEAGAASNDTWPFTLYLGDTTQLPDPTMETVYGAGEVCPMRGVAYEAVEEVDVGDYGNARMVVEYEAHATPATAALRIVKSNYDISGKTYHPNMPILVSWPETGDIVVSSNSLFSGYSTALVNAQSFAQSDLNCTGLSSSTAYWPNWNNDLAHLGIGIHVLADETQVALWHTGSSSDDIATTPQIYGALATDATVPLYTNFLTEAGVVGTEYMHASCLSQDGTMLFVFTNTTASASNATKWYRIEDATVTASGTCSPSVGLIAFGPSWRPHGVGLPASREGRAMAAENNGRYFWFLDSGANNAEIYYIDDGGNFADWGGGSIATAFPNDVGVEGSLQTLSREGFAGATRGDSLILLTRLGPPGPAILGDIVADLLERKGLTAAQYDVTDLTQEVRGFVIGSQMTVRNAIDILRKAFFFDVTEYDGKIVCVNRGHDAIDTIPDADLAAHEPGATPPEPLDVTRAPEAELPRTVYITYYDYDHDYQTGSQYWRRTVTRSQSDVTLDLPIVFTATEALLRAQWHMHFAWLERDRYTWFTTRKWAKLVPTDVVVVRGVNIRITSRAESPNGLIKFEGVRAFAGGYTAPLTDDGSSPAPGGEVPGSGGGGQPPQEPPTAKADTGLVLLDVPLIAESGSANSVRAAIYKDGGGVWAGASLYKSVDGGTTYASVLTTASASVVGTVATALATFAGGNVVDETQTITVVLADGTLSSTNEAGLLNGLNLIALGSVATGWELLQFRTATLTATNTYALSGLLRGRYGTEWMMGAHAADEILVLLSSTFESPIAVAEIGSARHYKAVTNGAVIADVTATSFTSAGVALKPWTPVLLGGGRDASGNLTLDWTPRRRGSGGWPDGVDLPPTEITEQYRVRIYTTSGYATVARTITVSAASTTSYSAANQTTDFGSPQATIYWDVAQLGAAGYGYAARGIT